MVASAIYKTILSVIKAGGVGGCDVVKAEALKPFAADHLLTIGNAPEASPNSPRKSGVPAYTGACRFLGQQTGERQCKTCSGRVMQKEFACHHPLHTLATVMECRTCADYEPGRGRHMVEKWAIGMTTAPRKRQELNATLSSLRRAGWRDRVYLFAETGSRTFMARHLQGPVTLIQRQGPALGAWSNFLLALAELCQREPLADAYLMLQDDVDLCQSLRGYLEEKLWPGAQPGVVSLHTPAHLAPRHGIGFFKADLGWNAWGAQALVFSNHAARALLADIKVMDHRLKGPLGGNKNVDSVVGEWCRRTKHGFWLHAPSLAEHTGQHSTLWRGTKLEGRRKSADFPGTAQPVDEMLEQISRIRGAQPPQPIVMRVDGTLGPLVPQPAKLPPKQQTAPLTPAAATPSFDDFWNTLTLDILSISIGRSSAFEEWSRWLWEADLPRGTSLVIVDNTRPSATSDMSRWPRQPPVSGRFRSLTTVQGNGPSDQPRTSDDRVRNCALHYGLGFARSTSEFVLVLDDDVIPPMDAVRRLMTSFHALRAEGCKPGLVSGCYESARSPGILVAGRDLTVWKNQPKVGELGAGDRQEVGFVGLGCALIHAPAWRKVGRFDLNAIHGNAGPDAWLCVQLRKQGFTLWLDGGVPCLHLHQEL